MTITTNPIKVLIVEDNPEWGYTLSQMYQNLINEIRPRVYSDIIIAVSGQQAMQRLERGETFDFISLDINLSNTDASTGDGREVLAKASEKDACKFMIVITGCKYDDTFTVYLQEGEELVALSDHLQSILEDLFPNRHQFLEKQQNRTPQECITSFLDLNRLTATKLKKWYESESRDDTNIESENNINGVESINNSSTTTFIPAPYKLIIASDQSYIDICSQANPKQFCRIARKGHLDLLLRMVTKREEYETEKEQIVTSQEVIDAYETKVANNSQLQSVADSKINNFRKFLRHKKRNIDPENLFENEPTLGWKLKLDPDNSKEIKRR